MTSMAPSTHKIIRKGDFVKVVTSKFVKRVGYPLVWTDLVEEVEKDPRTQAVWDFLIRPQPCDIEAPKFISADLGKLFPDYKVKSNIPWDFVAAIAKQRVREMGFGGKERQLIYKKTMTTPRNTLFGQLWTPSDDEVPDCTDRVYEVFGKKLAKTGKYFAPSSGTSGYYEPEDWYEPGGLEDCKTHILLETHMGWIEACNVELVKRAPGSTDKYPASSKYAPKSKIRHPV